MLPIWEYRFDYLFSYWIIIWYILYEFRIISQSPKLALIIAFIEVIVIFINMVFFRKIGFIPILMFVILNFFLKVVPLWRLRNEKIRLKEDLVNTGILFAGYSGWMMFNNRTAFEQYEHFISNEKYKVGPVTTPGTKFLLDIWHLFF